ncbi:MAG: Type III pantothenate kinase [Phycisphaerae bacterium]|nr:Type III pantothenate kinase [Phycisphaerae bacterium]
MIAPLNSPPAQHDLLVIDLGNTNINIGLWTHGAFRSTHKISREERGGLESMLVQYWSALQEPRTALCCTVVPAALIEVRRICEVRLQTKLQVIGDDIPMPIDIAISEPQSVGVDRLCTALAAYQGEQRSCVVADLGTALTVDCVNDQGQFLGGTILPGLHMQAQALARCTAQLPEVAIELPSNYFGQNTQQAIQLGIILGCAGAIREITERYATHLGHWPTLIATGGDAELIAQVSDIIDKIIPNLCLRGAVLAFESSCSPAGGGSTE